MFNENIGLGCFFNPSSVAVVGASENVEKIGGFIFSQVLKNKEIKPFPINNKSETIQRVKAYASIEDVEQEIDLCVIVIPAKFVLDVVERAAKKSCKNFVIISAGFKEIGDVGKEREDKLKFLIKKYDLNVIGPNCLGVLNPQIKLNLSFAKQVSNPGDVALISQSGAVIDAIVDWSFKENIGFSKIVSLGNMAGVNSVDILKFLKNDENTKAICFYMETLENAKEFADVLKEVSKTKPVVVIKPGNSQSAKKAIGSHTGSLAQDNVLTKVLIKKSGGIFVENLNELFNILIGLKMNLPASEKVVIVTNAGGPGVIATDEVERERFKLYEFDELEKAMLKSGLPTEASVNNPIDILGDAKSTRYEFALKKVLEFSQDVNVAVLLTPQIMTDSEEIAKKIVEFSKEKKNCIFSCFLGDKDVKSAVGYLSKNGVANFQTPSEAFKSLKYLREYFLKREENLVKEKENFFEFDTEKINKVKKELAGKRGLLDFNLTKKVLDSLEIKVVFKQIIKNKKDIKDVFLLKGQKYVLKVDGGSFVHKKDIGGVVLGVDNSNFEEKCLELLKKINGVDNAQITLEEEVSGVETIVGVKSDENLGDFIMFGAGGTFVSVFKDVNWDRCPLNIQDAKKLVEKSKVNTILKGFRGSKPINYEALFDVLVKISYINQIYPEICEVDLNPVICSEKGVYLVDVKLLI